MNYHPNFPSIWLGGRCVTIVTPCRGDSEQKWLVLRIPKILLNQRSQDLPDFIMNHNIGHLIYRGFCTIDDDELCPILFCYQWIAAGRLND